MDERPFLSIGEVLELLKEEFPDVTISKIRFLESQGLLDPERTPSGYRKFYDDDVARLRWILQQQRENFLPLKVIKERILTGTPPEAEATRLEPEPEPAPPGAKATAAAPPPAPADKTSPSRPAFDVGMSSVSLTLPELASAASMDVAGIQELERFGLLAARVVAGTSYYDEEALVVARLAAGMAKHGVDARHLRMYKIAAERETSLYEQVVSPLMKQRNPAARQQASDSLDDLAHLGEQLRSAFVRAALRPYAEA